MTTEAIRVLIADDQRVVRDGLSMLVALIDGVEVVGTASDGAEAVQLTKQFGATDGYKFVNAVLDRAAQELRPHEYGLG